MKRFYFATLLVLLGLSSFSQTKNFLDQPYLEVAGNADTMVSPDEIFIKIIISEKDTRDRISVEEQESKMYESLKALQIDVERNLTTSDMASNFKFYFLRGKDVTKSKQYILKVNDATTASEVFMKLEDIGISNTSIDRVNYSDLETIKNRMRTKAVESAKIRALALTKPLNQTVGSAIHIADLDFNAGNQFRGELQEVIVMGYGARKQNNAVLPKIEFEKIKVQVNLNVKFVLKS